LEVLGDEKYFLKDISAFLRSSKKVPRVQGQPASFQALTGNVLITICICLFRKKKEKLLQNGNLFFLVEPTKMGKNIPCKQKYTKLS
jgi:hypothetical protein